MFTNKEVNIIFFKTLILYTVSANLYFLSIFSSTSLEGNKFVSSIIVGCGFGAGGLLVLVMRQYMDDIYAYRTSIIVILVITLYRYY